MKLSKLIGILLCLLLAIGSIFPSSGARVYAQENTPRKAVNKTSVDVQKIWVGPKKDSATVKLLGDGKDTGRRLVLNEANSWKSSFKDIPETDDTGYIRYTVEEEPIPGYKSIVLGNSKDGFQIKNTNVETFSVHVTKKWIGKEARLVHVILMGDDKQAGSVDLTRDNGWTHVFENVPKYDEKDGHEIAYKLKEAYYQLEDNENEGATYDTKITGDAKSGFVITNTNNEEVGFEVIKKWVGKEGASATIRLLADGRVKQTATLSRANNWKYVFDGGLRRYDPVDGHEIDYKVEEDPVEGYKTSYSSELGYRILITNTEINSKTPEQPKNPEQPKTPERSKTPEQPETPEQPKTPEQSKTLDKPNTVVKVKTGQTSKAPKTSDLGSLPIYGSILLLSLTGISILFGKKRRMK